MGNTVIPLSDNFIKVGYSTGTDVQTYTGFSVSWKPYIASNSSTSDLLAKVISIVAVTLLLVVCSGCCLMCGYRIWRSYRNRSRYYPSRVIPMPSFDRRVPGSPQGGVESIYMSEDNIEALIPKSYFHPCMLEVGEAVCSICLEEFVLHCSVRKLPCKHLFHARCIEAWLASVGYLPNCPMCKENPFQLIMMGEVSSGEAHVAEGRLEPSSLMLRSNDELVSSL